MLNKTLEEINAIIEDLQKMIDEMTTTSDAEGFGTPKAFSSMNPAAERKRKNQGAVLGYTLVADPSDTKNTDGTVAENFIPRHGVDEEDEYHIDALKGHSLVPHGNQQRSSKEPDSQSGSTFYNMSPDVKDKILHMLKSDPEQVKEFVKKIAEQVGPDKIRDAMVKLLKSLKSSDSSFSEVHESASNLSVIRGGKSKTSAPDKKPEPYQRALAGPASKGKSTVTKNSNDELSKLEKLHGPSVPIRQSLKNASPEILNHVNFIITYALEADDSNDAFDALESLETGRIISTQAMYSLWDMVSKHRND